MLSVGTHRVNRPLSPVEVGRHLDTALKGGASPDEIADAVTLGTSMQARFRKLLELQPEVQHLVDWGTSGASLAFTAAAELARLVPEEQIIAANAVLEHKLTTSEVKQLIQLRERSRRPLPECVESVLKLRPRLERQFVFVGAITNESLTAKLRSRTQAERDELLVRAVQSAFPDIGPFGGRLGEERFTLVGGANLQSLRAGGRDFENEIAAALERVAA